MTYRLLYDTAGAAEMLSASEQQIDELRTAGVLPSVLDGIVRKFKHEDLRIYADSLPAADPKARKEPAQSSRPVQQDAPQSVSEKKSPSEELNTRWLRAEKAAQYASVSLWTIRHAVHIGDLEAYPVGKAGRHYRLLREDVDKWMMSRSWEPARYRD